MRSVPVLFELYIGRRYIGYVEKVGTKDWTSVPFFGEKIDRRFSTRGAAERAVLALHEES